MPKCTSHNCYLMEDTINYKAFALYPEWPELKYSPDTRNNFLVQERKTFIHCALEHEVS